MHNVLNIIEEAKVRANIKEILLTHPSITKDFQQAIYAFLKCHTLHGRLYIVSLFEGNNLVSSYLSDDIEGYL
jgi:hypothetical protein